MYANIKCSCVFMAGNALILLGFMGFILSCGFESHHRQTSLLL